MTQWAMAANRIDLSGAASARDAADIVRSRCGHEHAPATVGPTLVGVGFRDAVWATFPAWDCSTP